MRRKILQKVRVAFVSNIRFLVLEKDIRGLGNLKQTIDGCFPPGLNGFRDMFWKNKVQIRLANATWDALRD